MWLATTSRPPSTATLLQIYKEKMKGQRKREKNLRLDLSIIILLTSRLWNAVSKKVYVHFYDNSFSSSTVVYFLTTTVTTVTTGRTGATLYVTRWHTTGTTRLLLPTWFFSQAQGSSSSNLSTEQNLNSGRKDVFIIWFCHKIKQRVPAKKVSVDADNRVGMILSWHKNTAVKSVSPSEGGLFGGFSAFLQLSRKILIYNGI